MRVLQIIDSLEAGGAERMAVSYANMLAEDMESFLCVTRAEGNLKATINKQVGYLFLNKKRAIDVQAIFKLRNYIKKKDIDIIHAHSSSYFLAVLVKLLKPDVKIVWHDHYGNSEHLDNRSIFILKYASYYFNAIISVNKLLKEWSIDNLNCKKVMYIPNFVTFTIKRDKSTKLKGMDGKRIVCLANLRPQKDHINLLQAFKQVQQNYPDWSLHLVGKNFNDAYAQRILSFIKEHHLEKSVYCYGACPDVDAILQQCQIGVLSSKSEGLPVSLLEYGKNELAVVVTRVGECAQVVTHQKNGLVVEKQNALALAKGLQKLIEKPLLRKEYSSLFYQHINKQYSQAAIRQKVITLYQSTIN